MQIFECLKKYISNPNIPEAISNPPIKMKIINTILENDMPLNSTSFDLQLGIPGPQVFVVLSSSPVSSIMV